MNRLYCGNCKKQLIENMEIEYSDYLCEYFCSPDCATTKYFEFMGSKPLEKEFFGEHKIKLKDGKLYKI